jgi:hypothetical protein
MSLRWTILAPAYDRMARKSEEAGLGTMRESLLADAEGRVLEIGGGTGANLRYYEGLDSLVVTEPESAMLRRLRDKVRDQATQAEVVQAPAEDLLFLEHVRADDPALARFQDRLNRLNRFLVGCECNRETLTSIEAAGFTISRLERTTMPEVPKFVRPAVVGAALAPSLA